jgi:hypothetical protein
MYTYLYIQAQPNQAEFNGTAAEPQQESFFKADNNINMPSRKNNAIVFGTTIKYDGYHLLFCISKIFI